MNQDILSLYKKAQNGGLNAQEVFWLEGQAASHPCFGMAYMILARHHYRNQSTIKNKALLKAAAYSNNRGLLRGYLEDTLIAPKTKPVPVSEMKPVLEQRDAEAAAKVVSLQKENQPIQKSEASVEKVATGIVSDAISTTETSTEPVVDALAVAENTSEQAENKATEPIVETEAEVVETPSTNVEIEAPQPEAFTQEATVETQEIAPNQVAAEVPSAAALTYVGKPGDVNWFLNMRIKLRADKHKGTTQRLRASLEKHASLAQASQPTQPNVALAEEAPRVQSPVEKVESKSVESAKTVAEPQPILNAEAPATAENEALKNKKKRKNPEKQYEIGAFSSFTFLDGADGDETEDEIDSGITTLESVEFHAAENASGDGEIVFEENDRIIEITVSPEALHKYFNGKFPTDSSPAFGEFQIELDESEYHAAEHPVIQPTPAESPAVRKNDQFNETSGLDFQFLSRQEEAPSEDNRKKIDDIIDRFIENEPGITRAKSTGIPQGDLSKQSNNLQIEDWVTETLAKIYEKQGNKGKAIKIYEQLRLRFPEKNDYFVSLIEKLKHTSS